MGSPHPFSGKPLPFPLRRNLFKTNFPGVWPPKKRGLKTPPFLPKSLSGKKFFWGALWGKLFKKPSQGGIYKIFF
ncbi:hypothetical protein EBI_25896 [Enterocytozoon bieneusi H348]|nr:hypothetical protein EBI_25896 [Enterocytozoon bieneusi H348]|eukprot:XP_002650575.1 hypothetical protein EBI_25896 [Enterocytozoon bieneusi H348]